jgi:tetratricopeptide (TPR) repeat protein
VVGDFDQALAYANESVDAARRSGSPELLANLLSEQATVHRRRGDFDQAESLLEEVVAIEATHAGTFNLPSGAIGMALLFHDIGDHKRAYRHMIQAVEEERTWRTGGAVGWGSNTINRLRYLGLIEAARGNHRRATVILSATEAAASQVGQVPNPHDQEWLNTTITQLQETLGREAFQSAWDRGAGMSRDEAYDYALNLLDDA